MAGSATSYLEQAILGHTLAFAALPMPASVFVGLCTSAPTAQTPGTEVSGGGYSRPVGTFALANMPPNSIAANSATIQFPAATSDWGVIGWFEIWDANIPGGNRLYWGPLLDPNDGVTPITRQVLTGDIMRFQAGTLLVQAF